MRLFRFLPALVVLAATLPCTGCSTWLATRALADDSPERWSVPLGEVRGVSLAAPSSGMAIAARFRSKVEGEAGEVDFEQLSPGGPVVARSAAGRFPESERPCILVRLEDVENDWKRGGVSATVEDLAPPLLRTGDPVYRSGKDGEVLPGKAPLTAEEARGAPFVVFQRRASGGRFDWTRHGWSVLVSMPPAEGRSLEDGLASCERDLPRRIFLDEPARERSLARGALHGLLLLGVVPVTLALDVATFPIQGLVAIGIVLAR